MQAVDKILAQRVRPLRRTEYDQLVELGAFRNEHIELLFGRLVTMSPRGPSHAHAIRQLNTLLTRALAGRAEVLVQHPIAATDESEPEPDLAIIPPGEHLDAHPTTALWVIEVAETSLREDRDVKRNLYASIAVPEYWIVNLVDSMIETFRDPRDGSYTSEGRHQRGESVSPVQFPDATVEVSTLLRQAS